MRRAILTVMLSAVVASVGLPAQADHRGNAYPKVRTFSGGYYGPTQAHDQYQRRYGRPWHGQNGLYAGRGLGAVNGYIAGFGAVIGGWGSLPYGYYGYHSPHPTGIYGYGGYRTAYGPWCGFGHPSPWSQSDRAAQTFGNLTSPTAPVWLTPPAPGHPVLNDAWQEHLQRWELPLDVQPVIGSKQPALPPSTPAARIRSLRHQDRGDRRLQNLEYYQASRRYRDAISAAAERAEPHLHLAIAFAGMRNFPKAVKELRVGLTLDPAWASSGVSLDGLLGPENSIGKMHLKQAIAEWALEDVRNPDRLFLLGAMLYLDNDGERGRTILETAARLSGLHEHLAVFLRAGDGALTGGSQVESPVMADDSILPDDASAAIPELPALPPAPSIDDEQFPSAPEGTDGPTPQVNGPAFPD